MRSIPSFLHDHPFFAGFAPPVVDQLASCATDATYAENETIFTEGDHADAFYLIRHGRVAVQMHLPAGGAVILDTVDDGGALGWSWLVPPYRWAFDARASRLTTAVAFDADCLRRACEEDPIVGFLLMRRVNEVMMHRLHAARVRLVDLYGGTSP